MWLCVCAACTSLQQAKLDGPVVDYEATMATKLQLCRRIFDIVGHKSLQTQAYKVGS